MNKVYIRYCAVRFHLKWAPATLLRTTRASTADVRPGRNAGCHAGCVISVKDVKPEALQPASYRMNCCQKTVRCAESSLTVMHVRGNSSSTSRNGVRASRKYISVLIPGVYVYIYILISCAISHQHSRIKLAYEFSPSQRSEWVRNLQN